MAEKKLQVVLELVDKASADMKKASGSFNDLANTSKKVGAGMAIAGAAITAFGVKSLNLAREQIKVEKQLDAVIKSTGGAAGLTADQIKDMASSMQRMSNFGDEAIITGQNMLLTFTNIGKDVFPEATQTMLDMSAAMGTDLKTNAILVGKALNDPIMGISALSRVGVQLTDDQKDLIKSLQEVGDTAGAQSVILEELAVQFGGSAEAQIDPLIQLQNTWGDLMETIGKVVAEALVPLLAKIGPIVDKIQTWADENPKLFNTITLIVMAAGALMVVLGPLLIILPGLIAAFSALGVVIAFLTSPIFLVILAIVALIAIVAVIVWKWEWLKGKAIEIWTAIKDFIVQKVEEVRTRLETLWQTIQDNAALVMDVLFAISTGGMSLIVGWFIENREKIVGAIGGVWDAVKVKAISAFDGIKSALRGTMTFILSKVNKFIGGLNNVLSKVPGLKLNIPQLPAFAEGGIVTRPTVGLIGEAGAEAVIPLSKLGKGGLGGGTTININWSGAVDERAAEMVAREVARILDVEGRTSIAFGNV